MVLIVNMLKNMLQELIDERGIRGAIRSGKTTRTGQTYVAVFLDENQTGLGKPMTDEAVLRARLRDQLESMMMAQRRPEDQWLRRGTVHDRWSATCGRCLQSRIFAGDRDEALAELRAAHWELRERDGQTWCLDCSKRAREVPRRFTSRGRPRRRRR